VRLGVKPKSNLSHELGEDIVRVGLLLTSVNILDKNQQTSENHGDIVLVLHLECRAEDNPDQNFCDLEDSVSALRLQFQSVQTLDLLEERVAEVFDVNATSHDVAFI
jgi:hypothetical protein